MAASLRHTLRKPLTLHQTWYCHKKVRSFFFFNGFSKKHTVWRITSIKEGFKMPIIPLLNIADEGTWERRTCDKFNTDLYLPSSFASAGLIRAPRVVEEHPKCGIISVTLRMEFSVSCVRQYFIQQTRIPVACSGTLDRPTLIWALATSRSM